MFHTFAPAEEKIEKEEFESAESVWSIFLAAALALIGAADASSDVKQMSAQLVEAPCNSVAELEYQGDIIIKNKKNLADTELWVKMKGMKKKAPCLFDHTTYSDTSVSHSNIVLTMTPEQMQEVEKNWIMGKKLLQDAVDNGKKLLDRIQHNEAEKVKAAQMVDNEAEKVKAAFEHARGRELLLEEETRKSESKLKEIIAKYAKKEWFTREQKLFWEKISTYENNDIDSDWCHYNSECRIKYDKYWERFRVKEDSRRFQNKLFDKLGTLLWQVAQALTLAGVVKLGYNVTTSNNVTKSKKIYYDSDY